MDDNNFMLGQIVGTLRGVDEKITATNHSLRELSEKFDSIDKRIGTVEKKVWYHSGVIATISALCLAGYELVFRH